MNLSIHQEAAILRIANPFWRAPKDGRKRHGLLRTLHSLKRLGLAQYVDEGWSLTDEGEELLPELRIKATNSAYHQLRKLVGSL